MNRAGQIRYVKTGFTTPNSSIYGVARSHLFICLLSLAISLCSAELTLAQQAFKPYSFFVAGHTYGMPGVNNAGLHPPFKAKFNYIRSRPEIILGVLTGDIVSKNPVARDWDEVDADIAQLGLPVFFAVGNHDMENRPLYESRYGKTFYAFEAVNDLFIVLDPNIDRWNISGDQLIWLQDLLVNRPPNSHNIYVFFHQVLWYQVNNLFNYIKPNSFEGRAGNINFWQKIIPLFQNLPNRVYMFAGDLGAQTYSTDVAYSIFNNIRLIGSGMGSGEGDNFIVVNVDSNKQVGFDLICLEGPENCLGPLTGYVQQQRQNEINRVYPNPVSHLLTIDVYPDIRTTVELINLSGHTLVQQQSIGARHISLNVSGFPRGLYVLRISGEGFSSTSKLSLE